MECHDTGSTKVVRIDTGALVLAQQMVRIANTVVEQNAEGNGEIIFKLTVNGGKISRLLSFAGKWFPHKSNREH